MAGDPCTGHHRDALDGAQASLDPAQRTGDERVGQNVDRRVRRERQDQAVLELARDGERMPSRRYVDVDLEAALFRRRQMREYACDVGPRKGVAAFVRFAAQRDHDPRDARMWMEAPSGDVDAPRRMARRARRFDVAHEARERDLDCAFEHHDGLRAFAQRHEHKLVTAGRERQRESEARSGRRRMVGMKQRRCRGAAGRTLRRAPPRCGRGARHRSPPSRG